MVSLVGGLISLLLGLIGLFCWLNELILFVKSLLPLFLLLGGGVAIYLGVEDMKNKRKAEIERISNPFQSRREYDLEKYKKEIAELRAKLDSVKNLSISDFEKEKEIEKD